MRKGRVFLLIIFLTSTCWAESLVPRSEKMRNALRNEAGNWEIKGGRFFFKDVPVKAGKRYRLTVRARIKKGNALETHPLAKQALEMGVPNLKFPHVFFEFRNGKKHVNIMYFCRGARIFRTKFRDYILEFYAADSTDAVRVFFRLNDGKNILEVEKAELLERDEKKEKYRNINDSLQFGKYNHSGFGGGTPVFSGENKNGLYIAQSGWSVCDPIPVKPGERYRLSGRAERLDGTARFGIFFLPGAHFKKIIGKQKIQMTHPGKGAWRSWEFQVPPKAFWLRLTFSNMLLYSMKLEKLN